MKLVCVQQAVEEFDGERRTLTTKYKKAVRKAMQHDQARATAAAELQHTRFQVRNGQDPFYECAVMPLSQLKSTIQAAALQFCQF